MSHVVDENSTSSLRSYYDPQEHFTYTHYYENCGDDPFIIKGFSILEEKVKQYSPCRTLEVGCGLGLLSGALMGQWYDVPCIEYSQRRVKMVSEKFQGSISKFVGRMTICGRRKPGFIQ
jgi:2-polyprenyl-3-methyl-5-hydroxy-6-metoxy-1,4-benzoquinol methylase